MLSLAFAAVLACSRGLSGPQPRLADVQLRRPAANHAAFLRTETVLSIAGLRGTGIRVDEIDGDRTVERMTFDGMPAPFEVVLDPATGRVARFIDRSSGETTTTSFADYRTVAGIEAPWRTTIADRTGTTVETVVKRTGLADVPAGVFRRPAPPDDTHLDGLAEVPFAATEDGIVLPVVVNGRARRLVLDSGSSNFLTPEVARLVGVATVPYGRSGGIGARVVEERLGLAKTVAVGAAHLTDQPFSVLAYDTALTLSEDTLGAYADTTLLGNLGNAYLRRYASVTFDYASHRMWLEPRRPTGR